MSSPGSGSGGFGEYSPILGALSSRQTESPTQAARARINKHVPPYNTSPEHAKKYYQLAFDDAREIESPTQAARARINTHAPPYNTSPEHAKKYYKLAFDDAPQPSPHRGNTRQYMSPLAGSENPPPPASPRGLSSTRPHVAPSAGTANPPPAPPLPPRPSRGVSSTPPPMSQSLDADNAPAQAPPAASTQPGTPPPAESTQPGTPPSSRPVSHVSHVSDITPPHTKPPSSRPWYRTTRCKIIAVALLVTVLAFAAWGSYELHEYLNRPSKSAVVTQGKPDDESNGKKPMPNKPSIFTTLTHTKAEITHTEARIPHTEAGITHTETEITHTEAIFPHTVPSQDCQETGCDSNQQCLATGECVCADGFTGDDCKRAASQDANKQRVAAFVIVIISLLAGIILVIIGILYKRSKSAHVQRA